MASPSEIPSGLTSARAAGLLAQFGPNAVAEEREHPLLALLKKFSAPVPWMLEATIVLELALHRNTEALVIAFLLVFNAVLSFAQEGHAKRALDLLRSRLAILARVERDGAWQRIPSERIVPGDLIYLRAGDMAPADVRIASGNILVDHSTVTGESAPVELAAGATGYAGGVVRRGEATAVVTATGARTFFGKTAQLVREAHAAGHLQQTIFSIVKWLVAIDLALAIAVFAFALSTGFRWTEIAPFCLMLLIASIPVALPATFTLASAVGTKELARRGVLVVRLAAIEEAAAMDTLATDKTGTLTKNELSVSAVSALPGFTEADVIRYAALASSAATEDPIDIAILSAEKAVPAEWTIDRFVPFDPATRISEAFVRRGAQSLHVVKGAPAEVAALTHAPFADPDRYAEKGYRVIAVAAGADGHLAPVGAIALLDPPRDDSRPLVDALNRLGVRVLMITGDGLATARTVAQQTGITGGATAAADVLRDGKPDAAANYNVFAAAYPEDKFRLVKALQATGHVTGMTGDGVNDAPALRQAEVGVAVANATDVARAAASIVLTGAGLSGIVAAVESSRRIYQRMLTYTLNKITKTIEIAFFLSIGVLAARVLVTTPVLIVLLLFTNDFLTMSIATDNVSFSQKPDRWRIRSLVLTAAPLAGLELLFSLAILFFAMGPARLPIPQVQTTVFLTLVFIGQATVYMVRERGHFWKSRPSRWMFASSSADIIAVSLLATFGILMAPVPVFVPALLLAAAAIYLVLADFAKIRIFRRFGVQA